jgi:flavin reductase (DIM6/NTAB) family NADH-FMN oxidoreductase RutF
MSRPEPSALPPWDPGTVAILSTGAGAPHAIPVSTAVWAGPRTVLLALALRRESLARLREEPRCALTILAGGDVAVTAHGRAAIVEEPMAVSDGVAAVRIDVEAIQDHGQDRFEIDAGVRWHWTDEEADRRDADIRAALTVLGERD